MTLPPKKRRKKKRGSNDVREISVPYGWIAELDYTTLSGLRIPGFVSFCRIHDCGWSSRVVLASSGERTAAVNRARDLLNAHLGTHDPMDYQL